MSARSDYKWPRVILASSSPRRATLLRESGIDFTIVHSDAPEIQHEFLTGGELAKINAYRKARAVAKKYPDSLVLAADTVVCLESTLFGKPATLEEAYLMLQRLQGQTHHVITAICLLHLREKRYNIVAESTEVTFRSLDAVGIRKYLQMVDPLDKAGAYGIQEQGDLIIQKVSGSYTNVVGLPMERLQAELRRWAAAPLARAS